MSEQTNLSTPAILPMKYADASDRLTRVTKMLRELEREHANAIVAAAESEAVYRHEVGTAIAKYRDQGLAVDDANARARADCFVLSKERDSAAGKVRTVLEKLENRRGERESLNRLVAWSHSLDIRDGGSETSWQQ
jgi:hypothetical protein